MATTNAQQFNPAAINQETDAQYTADSNRSGGFGTDAIWPSPLANKALYQLSTYITALFQAFANKGFTTSDADLSVLTAVCANFLTTADQVTNILTVAYSPTPAFNAGATNGFSMTLSGNITSSTISGVKPGQLIAFYFTQDGVGGRTVVWPSSFSGAAQPDPTPNAVSLQIFRVGTTTSVFAATPMMSSNGSFFPSQISATSGAFSGIVTAAGSVASSDNSTKVATTLWAKLGMLISAAVPGYIKFPSWMGGLMFQWGHVTTDINGGTKAVAFPTNFPTAAFVVIPVTLSPTDRITYVVNGSLSASGFTIGNNGSSGFAYWFAIGN